MASNKPTFDPSEPHDFYEDVDLESDYSDSDMEGDGLDLEELKKRKYRKATLAKDNWFYSEDAKRYRNMTDDTFYSNLQEFNNDPNYLKEFFRRNNYIFISHKITWNNEEKKKNMNLKPKYSEYKNVYDSIEDFRNRIILFLY